MTKKDYETAVRVAPAAAERDGWAVRRACAVIGHRARAEHSATAGTAVNAPPSPPYPDPAWLALQQEEIIEPGLEIVDFHHHLWDRPGHRFLPRELFADTDLETASRPYIETCIAAFGTDRSMFESNFPPASTGWPDLEAFPK
jgi:hypothetical protein